MARPVPRPGDRAGCIGHSFAARDQRLDVRRLKSHRATHPDPRQLPSIGQPPYCRQRNGKAISNLPNGEKTHLVVACIAVVEHGPISPALTLPAKGAEYGCFPYFGAPPEPPSQWAVTHFGAPVWIAGLVATPELLPWGTVIHEKTGSIEPRSRGPAELQLIHGLILPHLFPLVRQQRDAEPRATATESRGRGAPPRARAAPREATLAAWLTDGHGYTPARVADHLGLGGTNERSTRRTGLGYVTAGRKLLNDHGVLPWTLWPDGSVADQWWMSHEFSSALHLWYLWVRSRRPDIDRLREVNRRLADAARVHDRKPPLDRM